MITPQATTSTGKQEVRQDAGILNRHYQEIQEYIKAHGGVPPNLYNEALITPLEQRGVLSWKKRTGKGRR